MLEDDNNDIITSVVFRQDDYEVEIVRTFNRRRFDREYQVVVRDPKGTEIVIPGRLWHEAKEYKV